MSVQGRGLPVSTNRLSRSTCSVSTPHRFRERREPFVGLVAADHIAHDQSCVPARICLIDREVEREQAMKPPKTRLTIAGTRLVMLCPRMPFAGLLMALQMYADDILCTPRPCLGLLRPSGWPQEPQDRCDNGHGEPLSLQRWRNWLTPMGCLPRIAGLYRSAPLIRRVENSA